MFFNCWDNRKNRSFLVIFVTFCLANLSACVTNSSVEFEYKAATYPLDKSVLAGKNFDYVVFKNQKADTKQLHVYIGGDGQPWLNNRYRSKDPTTRRMTTLGLMSLDEGPAIYMGRPCYHVAGVGRGCSDQWWTSHRYSKIVVNDMHYVLSNYIADHGVQSLTIIGFSGGGALAMLLAPLIKETATLITISGNLDTDAWGRRHNFTPLFNSLNPAHQPEIRNNIRKIHLVGMQDKNIPVDVIISRFENQQNTEIIRYPSFTHHCCWQAIWLDILNQI